MKKIIVTTFCTLMLCGLLLTIGAVMAAAPGYITFSHPTQVTPTLDGKWTTDDEWTDGNETWIGTDIVFRTTLDNDMTRWIVEFLTDTTNDPGDYWRFCVDVHQTGGAEPQFAAGHYMIKISGHSEPIGYMGTVGGGWAERPLTSNDLEWADSLSASAASSTPHWILEFQIDRETGDFRFPNDVFNFFLQAYDESNPGFHAWPPTDPDVPDDWGIKDHDPEPIPEGLTFAVMALLTTVSMLVGYRYFVKRKETKTQ